MNEIGKGAGMSEMVPGTSVDWGNKIRSSIVDGLRHCFNDGIFSDVEIEVNDNVFPCHKVFLCAISDYFFAMFTSGMKESVDSRVTINDLSGATFKTVLDFYYNCDRSVINADSAEDLLRASGLLQMVTLQDSCEAYYAENLNTDNALAVWSLAQHLHREGLAQTAKRFILSNFLEICTEPDFLLLDITHVVELISDDDLRVPDEDYVVKAAISWLKHDIGTRTRYLSEIFTNLRLRFISDDCFTWLLDFIKIECPLKDSHFEKFISNRRHSFPEDPNSVIMDNALTSRNYENMLVVVGVHRAIGILPSVHAYSFNTKMWFKLSSLPFDPGVGYATCVLDNYLYLSGISLRKAYVLRFDPEVNLWKECCEMPEKRRYHEMVVVWKKMHAVCGWNKRDGVFTSIIQYHPVEDSWTSIGDLQVGVYSASSCALDHTIYVFGGRADDSTRKTDIQSFNLVTRQATVLTHFPIPVTESRALAMNSCMYLALTNGAIMKMMESGVMTKCVTLPHFDRFNFGLLERGSNILVVGGETRFPSVSNHFGDILEVNAQEGKVRVLHDHLFNSASAAACRILLIRRVLLPRLSVSGIVH